MLTTDRHEASRGLFEIAELLVVLILLLSAWTGSSVLIVLVTALTIGLLVLTAGLVVLTRFFFHFSIIF